MYRSPTTCQILLCVLGTKQRKSRSQGACVRGRGGGSRQRWGIGAAGELQQREGEKVIGDGVDFKWSGHRNPLR